MARLLWMLLAINMALAAAVGAAAPPALYSQLGGGEEECEVTGKTTLSRLALEKGVKWTVLARQNCLKKPFKLSKGMVLKINTLHILPIEPTFTNGFVINLPELHLYYFANCAYQRRYSLAVGKPSWPTPTGNYKIIEKRKDPIWNVPPSIQDEMEEQGLEVIEKVPPGPKNPLGKYFMATSASGVGIHATNRPWSVGSYASHGCIRMLPNEIEKLFPEVTVGTPVKIIYRPIKLAATPEGRIYLEAHSDIYQKKIKPLEFVQEMAQCYQLTDLIDWGKVPAILKAKDGVAHEITKGTPVPRPAVTPQLPDGPQEVRLSPLHDKNATIE